MMEEERPVLTARERAERVQHEIRGIKAQYGLNANDEAFLDNVRTFRGPITPAMEAYLARLERQVFPS